MIQRAKAAHFYRLILNDSPRELRQIRLIVRFSPDAHADAHSLDRLLPEDRIELPALGKRKQIHPAAVAGVNFRLIRPEGLVSPDFPEAVSPVPVCAANDLRP